MKKKKKLQPGKEREGKKRKKNIYIKKRKEKYEGNVKEYEKISRNIKKC